MKEALSISILVLCCLSAAAFAFVAAMQLPYAIAQDSEGWGSMIFRSFTGPLIAAATLLFGVVPSAIMFWKGGRQRRDRVSLCISATTLGLVVLMWVLIEPLRQMIIFGK